VISFVVDTTAELIKIAPVHHALTARGTKPQLWFSAYPVDEIADVLEDLRLPEPDLWLVPRDEARNIETPEHDHREDRLDAARQAAQGTHR
jgi:UDP-N-acetylglucosamine 2-epimerase (non-hydrolysing)